MSEILREVEAFTRTPPRSSSFRSWEPRRAVTRLRPPPAGGDSALMKFAAAPDALTTRRRCRECSGSRVGGESAESVTSAPR